MSQATSCQGSEEESRKDRSRSDATAVARLDEATSTNPSKRELEDGFQNASPAGGFHLHRFSFLQLAAAAPKALSPASSEVAQRFTAHVHSAARCT